MADELDEILEQKMISVEADRRTHHLALYLFSSAIFAGYFTGVLVLLSNYLSISGLDSLVRKYVKDHKPNVVVVEQSQEFYVKKDDPNGYILFGIDCQRKPDNSIDGAICKRYVGCQKLPSERELVQMSDGTYHQEADCDIIPLEK